MDVNEQFYKTYPEDLPRSMSLLDYLNPIRYIDPYNTYSNPFKRTQQVPEASPVQPSISVQPNVPVAQAPEANKGFKMGDLTDYIPNIFARNAPTTYDNLQAIGLITPQQVAQQQKTANIQGLLGAGLALAQGMSKIGPRRSAAENILGALAGGFGASAGAYQQGMQNIMQQQQLAQSQIAVQQAAQQRQAIDALLKSPEVANDPVLVAYIRANPNEALKMLSEQMPLKKAIAGGQTPAPTAPQAAAQAAPQPEPIKLEPSMAVTAEGQQFFGVPNYSVGERYADEGMHQKALEQRQTLPPVVTSERAPEAKLQEDKDRIIEENRRLSALTGKAAQDRVKQNLDQIAAIDKQLDRFSAAQVDFNAIEAQVPEQFKGRVRTLKNRAETGALSLADVSKEIADIENKAIEFVTKKTDYTNQDRRVFGGMFRNPDGTPRSIETATPTELLQLENKLFEMRVAERKAGATSINMPSESERTAGFLTNRVVNSLNQLQTVVGATPTAASPKFSAEAIKFLTGSEYLKNLANPEARQRVEAAQLEILDAALTLGTGAAYTREQLENYRRSYFPMLGDKPETIKDKQQRLKSLLDSAMIKSGRAAPVGSLVNSPAFDINAIEQELERRKGKK
jgi:hypothetical protein